MLGVLLGLSIAVILQQAGVWPLDRLLVFGLAGLFGLIGILLAGWGRERVSAMSIILPLLLAVGMIAWGATGIADLDESGELNGGCTVEAQSDVDSTIITDTSRGDPFEVDPEGGLSWVATSPAPIMNHTWEIWVDFGGFHIVIADGGEPNTAGDQENQGDVPDVTAYVEEVTAVSGQQIRGVFEVGGEISGEGGECDGFAFVTLTADPVSTLPSRIAAVLGLIALISLIVLASRRTRVADVVPEIEDQAAASGVAAASVPPPVGVEEPVEPAPDASGGGESGPIAAPDEKDEDFPPTT